MIPLYVMDYAVRKVVIFSHLGAFMLRTDVAVVGWYVRLRSRRFFGHARQHKIHCAEKLRASRRPFSDEQDFLTAFMGGL